MAPKHQTSVRLRSRVGALPPGNRCKEGRGGTAGRGTIRDKSFEPPTYDDRLRPGRGGLRKNRALRAFYAPVCGPTLSLCGRTIGRLAARSATSSFKMSTFARVGTGFPSNARTWNRWPGEAREMPMLPLALSSRSRTRSPSHTRIGLPSSFKPERFRGWAAATRTLLFAQHRPENRDLRRTTGRKLGKARLHPSEQSELDALETCDDPHR
jgi:hypothetical protein